MFRIVCLGAGKARLSETSDLRPQWNSVASRVHCTVGFWTDFWSLCTVRRDALHPRDGGAWWRRRTSALRSLEPWQLREWSKLGVLTQQTPAFPSLRALQIFLVSSDVSVLKNWEAPFKSQVSRTQKSKWLQNGQREEPFLSLEVFLAEYVVTSAPYMDPTPSERTDFGFNKTLQLIVARLLQFAPWSSLPLDLWKFAALLACIFLSTACESCAPSRWFLVVPQVLFCFSPRPVSKLTWALGWVEKLCLIEKGRRATEDDFQRRVCMCACAPTYTCYTLTYGSRKRGNTVSSILALLATARFRVLQQSRNHFACGYDSYFQKLLLAERLVAVSLVLLLKPKVKTIWS